MIKQRPPESRADLVEGVIGSKEAGEILGVSRYTVHRWVREGKLIPSHKLPSGYARFSREEIIRLRSEMSAK